MTRPDRIAQPAMPSAPTSGKRVPRWTCSQEPPPGATIPLFALDNVILPPHSTGLSKEAAIRIAISTARNALAGMDGKLDPSMVVNREVLLSDARAHVQPLGHGGGAVGADGDGNRTPLRAPPASAHCGDVDFGPPRAANSGCAFGAPFGGLGSGDCCHRSRTTIPGRRRQPGPSRLDWQFSELAVTLWPQIGGERPADQSLCENGSPESEDMCLACLDLQHPASGLGSRSGQRRAAIPTAAFDPKATCTSEAGPVATVVAMPACSGSRKYDALEGNGTLRMQITMS